MDLVAGRVYADERRPIRHLDPTLLLAPMDRLRAGVDDVLRRAGGRPGHIFNLGHGILPPTPLEHVQEVARYVHARTARS